MISIATRQASAGESLLDTARATLAHCTRKGVNHFALYDVVDEVVGDDMGAIVKRAFNGSDDPNTPKMVMGDWGKSSFFRFDLPLQEKLGYTYRCGVVIGRRTDIEFSRHVYREWAAYSAAMKLIPGGSDLSRVLGGHQDVLIAAQIAILTSFSVMRAILARPTEYRLSRGIRTAHERMRNIPAVTTISLSKPTTHTAPSGHHSGIKMPEHDVRGHERRLKSGKVVWVSGHKRGDPNVPRRTVYRVVP